MNCIRYGLLAACIVGSAALAYNSPISEYAGLDPKGTTLTAQALLQHQTIRLDSYVIPKLGWQFHVIKGHTYYAYPLGTPFFSTPFVLLGLLTGKDMQVQADDVSEQKMIAAVLLATSVLLIYFINNCYLGGTRSALLTIPWAFGSGMTTTMGAALWSIDFFTVFALGVLLIVARYSSGKSDRLRPHLTGILLFAAYFCRPTAAVFVVVVVLCYWWLSPWASVRVVAVCAILFAGFVCFSQFEFGDWLPFYYLPSYFLQGQVKSFHQWTIGARGLFFNPSRGLFVYQPYLLLSMGGAIVFARRLAKQPIFWLATGWLILHFLLMSRWAMWWGGGGYGSRLMVDSLPGWVVLTALAAQALGESRNKVLARAANISFVLLSACAIFIHSVQGLYNPATFDWNIASALRPVTMFEWQHAQFLASPKMIRALAANNLVLAQELDELARKRERK
jgi:hypothetical protein